MKLVAAISAATLFGAAFGNAYAQGLQAVRPAKGLVCMSLDDAAAAATNQQSLPPLRAQPDSSAVVVGYPTSILFTNDPPVTRNGFTEIVRYNGQTGWLGSGHVILWHAANRMPATCTPSIMSNGRLGTRIRPR